MLTGPQRKFCEGVIAGQTGVAAYRAAYRKASEKTARFAASALKAKREIKAEIDAMRQKADTLAGSAVLTLMEKRIFLARVVRAAIASTPPDSDLWQSVRQMEGGTVYLLPDKLKAIALDNDLAGEGSEAEGQDALGELLLRCMK